MKKVTVELGERSYPIEIGTNMCFSDSFADRIGKITGNESVLIVTDSFVKPSAEKLAALLKRKVAVKGIHVFPEGEQSKNFATVERICRKAAKLHLDRKSFFLAVGGGVTGDLTGFAAAIYMRGARFIQIPTSLLAMADSSVGGKTAADLPEGINLIGAFLQPQAVFIDPAFLDTIKSFNISLGFAEILKIAATFDADFFGLLEKNAFTLSGRKDPALFEEVLQRACRLKADVVAKDEKESSLRAMLNFGHTFGHALEKLDGFDRMYHGFGVSCGMYMACRLAEELGLQEHRDTVRLANALYKYNLPVYFPARFGAKDVYKAMLSDKKAAGGKLKFILPCGIGKGKIVEGIPKETVLAAMEKARSGYEKILP
ncbi:MAG: 3-dehydroquinate synthase [Lentisphaeria bacterium]|nr:3-dehydroquinate synthase [Lentisphaeria bacterium]